MYKYTFVNVYIHIHIYVYIYIYFYIYIGQIIITSELVDSTKECINPPNIKQFDKINRSNIVEFLREQELLKDFEISESLYGMSMCTFIYIYI
jgi:hypothetical protein